MKENASYIVYDKIDGVKYECKTLESLLCVIRELTLQNGDVSIKFMEQEKKTNGECYVAFEIKKQFT